MKKFILFSLLVAIFLVYNSCTDDNEKQYNTLIINSGEFSGFTYSYVPNTGFWSPVNGSTRQVHLVLGGTENIITDYENKMSILFYYEGEQTIDFPGTSGQWVNFGLTTGNVIYYFTSEDAVLTINTLDDSKFEGSLSGTFVNINNGSQAINFTMDIRVDLQQI
jgi:hypothetical protein